MKNDLHVFDEVISQNMKSTLEGAKQSKRHTTRCLIKTERENLKLIRGRIIVFKLRYILAE